MKYCQNPKCHEHKTKDRIRGSKGDKHYETRKRSSMYYGKGNFCCQTCMYEWVDMYIERGLDHFGRIHEPKRIAADSAWYKDYTWSSGGNYDHYFKNDLLGQRISITQQQYDNQDLTTPPTTS